MIIVGEFDKKIPGQLGLESVIDDDRSVTLLPLVNGVNLYFKNGQRIKSLHISDDAAYSLLDVLSAYAEARENQE